jgi:nitroimidazol reductase NimA-like FMN-containing flavoprotein (pyridoxamine 5'-phosphate oxidase superfamily)
VRYRSYMARKDISMAPDEVITFLDETAVLEVGTIGGDGWPHLAPMWFVMENDRIVFRSFTRSQKIVNLHRDPRLTVLAETGDAYEELRGVMIKAEARLVEDPAYVLAIYGRLAAKYAMVGPEPVELTERELEDAFGRFAAKNTAVVVEPVKTASWDHRKIGGGY